MKLLVLVKSLPKDQALLSLSSLIVQATGGEMTLLHVARERADIPAGELMLEAIRSMLPDHMTVYSKVRFGSPFGRCLVEIAEGKHDIVAMGQSKWDKRLRESGSSFGRTLYRRSPISVLFVGQPREKIERILVCTSGVESAINVIKCGGELARSLDAKITLLHVAHMIPVMYTGLSMVKESLPELLQTDTPIAQHLRSSAEILHEMNLEAELQLRRGVAVDEILREANFGNYDLIIVGASDATTKRVKGLLMGDAAREIINNTERPVLIFRRALIES